MRARVTQGLIACLIVAFIGLAIVVSGVVPVGASSGHWRATKWFLDFAKARSVSLHSRGITVPPLDDPGLVVVGAAHYESGCRPCHAAPGRPRSEVAGSMTPAPPSLDGAAREYRPEELFYIVKHGIKLTGMPAWPAPQRDDEVWAVVAFLRAMPGMSASRYRALAFGDTVSTPADDDVRTVDDTGLASVQDCVRCHGSAGFGRPLAAVPRLGSLSREYIIATLRAYKHGERHSGLMQPLAAVLDDAAIVGLARRFAASGVVDNGVSSPRAAPRGQPAGAEQASTTPRNSALERGASIARRGIPQRRIPACAACHGPASWPLNPRFPALAGQSADYLKNQLDLFRQRRRGGSEYAVLMSTFAERLDEASMRNIAAWYASLAPAVPSTEAGGR